MDVFCSHCSKPFEVTLEELAFLKRVSPVFGGHTLDLPPPKCCPSCRWQQRLSFRNERSLFRRTCDLTGQAVISIYPAGTKFPVYNILDWISDKWDATEYGRDFDFSRPFFEQYKEMADTVPHFNLSIDPRRDVNSEYTNCATESKNCYLISQAEVNEDCYYSRGINNCRNCCDCLRVDRCELCYEGINLSLCYNCFFCQDCDNCNECYFSTNLRACKYCFGCHNLIQKEYHFFNEPLSRTEWEARVRAFQFTPLAIRETQARSEQLRFQTPHRYARVIQSEDSTGDHLTNSRDARECYDSRNLEHCAYVTEIQNGAKYCRDFSICGLDTELLYNCIGCGYSSYHLLFCSAAWSNVSELIYCDSCGPSVKHCFGCNGLRSKEYCVLNKPYTPSEYERLVVKIVDHMRETGEWGEFFPPWVSADAYNNTIANSYFPLKKEEVIAHGWNWRDNIEAIRKPSGEEKSKTAILSKDATEALCDETHYCERTGRPFKIIKPELHLLKRLGLPIPHIHPEERHHDRFQRRNPRQLWKRSCQKCGTQIESTYSPNRSEIVYCESCYLEAMS